MSARCDRDARITRSNIFADRGPTAMNRRALCDVHLREHASIAGKRAAVFAPFGWHTSRIDVANGGTDQ
jgi:hypothetical protein